MAIGFLGPCMGVIRWKRVTGPFAEFVDADVGLVVRIPEAIGWDEAARLGAIGWGTLGLALWDVSEVLLSF